MAIDREKFIRQLVGEESLRLHPYRDSVGKLTIGIGRNIDDKGITKEEAYYLCGNDIAEVEAGCKGAFPWWDVLNEVRQRVIADMAFNLGLWGLLAFHQTLASL